MRQRSLTCTAADLLKPEACQPVGHATIVAALLARAAQELHGSQGRVPRETVHLTALQKRRRGVKLPSCCPPYPLPPPYRRGFFCA